MKRVLKVQRETVRVLASATLSQAVGGAVHRTWLCDIDASDLGLCDIRDPDGPLSKPQDGCTGTITTTTISQTIIGRP
jgi:hypothetical protein